MTSTSHAIRTSAAALALVAVGLVAGGTSAYADDGGGSGSDEDA